MTSAQIAIMATIIAYLCFVIVIGIMIGRRSKKSSEGFYLGGRGMGPLVTAMSAEASDMSSWLLMGLPGVAYLSGVADAGWTAIGLAVGTYLNFLLVAKKIRRYSVKLDAITIPSFISKRYGEKKPVIMCIASVIILIFFVPYVASGQQPAGLGLYDGGCHWRNCYHQLYLCRWIQCCCNDGSDPVHHHDWRSHCDHCFWYFSGRRSGCCC